MLYTYNTLYKALGTNNNITYYSNTNRQKHLKNKSTVKVNKHKQKLKNMLSFKIKFSLVRTGVKILILSKLRFF